MKSKIEFKEEELKAAFDLVKDQLNWKNPIQATIDQKDKAVVARAITYYTGSIPEFRPLSDGKLYVFAVGYYVAIGA